MAGGWLVDGISTQYTAPPRCTRVTRPPPTACCSLRRTLSPTCPLWAVSAVQRWCGTMRPHRRSCAPSSWAARRRSSGPQCRGGADSDAGVEGAWATGSGSTACAGATVRACRAPDATATGLARAEGPCARGAGGEPASGAATAAGGTGAVIHTMAEARTDGAMVETPPRTTAPCLRVASHHVCSARSCSPSETPTAISHLRAWPFGLMARCHRRCPVPTPAGRPAGTAGIRKWRPGFQSAPP